MARLKRVLAATDFSPFSRHAVERAAFIASSVGAELDLLHVLSLAPLQDLEQLMADLPPGFADTVIAAARAELQAVADDLAARHGVNVTCRMACGPLLATLHAESVASQADLLVLGARGESGVFRNMVLGTTAARMISKTLHSAIANAENNHGQSADGWRVKTAVVNDGPRLKRSVPRSRGMARPILKRLCHITVTLTDGAK